MQVVVEGAARDIAELATDGWNAARPIGHEVLRIAQLVDGHDPRPATFSAPCSRREDAFPDALADEVALHLGESGLDLQRGLKPSLDQALAQALCRVSYLYAKEPIIRRCCV